MNETTKKGSKMTDTTRFETGNSYQARSICDHNCIWTVKVIKRTTKFLTITVDGSEAIRVGINTYNDVEHCYFSGKYSMAPSIAADRAI